MIESTPRVNSYMDLHRMRQIAQSHDSHWFDPDTIRFFSSRICESTIVRSVRNPHWWIFVSSERCNWGVHPRLYTIRLFDDQTGDVETIGEFQQYASRNGAVYAIGKINQEEVSS